MMKTIISMELNVVLICRNKEKYCDYENKGHSLKTIGKGDINGYVYEYIRTHTALSNLIKYRRKTLVTVLFSSSNGSSSSEC